MTKNDQILAKSLCSRPIARQAYYKGKFWPLKIATLNRSFAYTLEGKMADLNISLISAKPRIDDVQSQYNTGFVKSHFFYPSREKARKTTKVASPKTGQNQTLEPYYVRVKAQL